MWAEMTRGRGRGIRRDPAASGRSGGGAPRKDGVSWQAIRTELGIPHETVRRLAAAVGSDEVGGFKRVEVAVEGAPVCGLSLTTPGGHRIDDLDVEGAAELFLFANVRRTSCKVLLWNGTGLCIFMNEPPPSRAWTRRVGLTWRTARCRLADVVPDRARHRVPPELRRQIGGDLHGADEGVSRLGGVRRAGHARGRRTRVAPGRVSPRAGPCPAPLSRRAGRLPRRSADAGLDQRHLPNRRTRERPGRPAALAVRNWDRLTAFAEEPLVWLDNNEVAMRTRREPKTVLLPSEYAAEINTASAAA